MVNLVLTKLRLFVFGKVKLNAKNAHLTGK